MGASRSSRSSSPSNVEARSYFYTGMTDLNLCPVDFVAGLARFARIAYLEQRRRSSVIHAAIHLAASDGDGYLELTQVGRDLLVIVDDFSLKRPNVETVRDGGLIQLDFRLSGDVSLGPSDVPTVRVNGPGLFISAHPPGSVSTRLTGTSSREKGVTLVLTPEFLTDEFLDPCGLADSPLRRLVSTPIVRTQSYAVPLTARLSDIIGQFFACRYTGKLSHRYTEGLALELLCVAISDRATGSLLGDLRPLRMTDQIERAPRSRADWKLRH